MRGRLSLLLWGAGLLALLAVGALVAGQTQETGEGSGIPLDAHSARPEGALALYLWTERLGRDADFLEYEPFALGAGEALLVSLRPFDAYEPEQIRELRGWLAEGGTLLLALEGGQGGLLDALGVRLQTGRQYTAAHPAQPLLREPPVETVSAAGRATLGFESGVPLLVSEAPEPAPVLVADGVGKGRVWVLSVPNALSNARLGSGDNARLYLHVLAEARDGRVVFDEYHHGKPEVGGLQALVLGRPWGWAFLYAVGILLLYTALRGKRLGRALTAGRPAYRSSGEYVLGLAGLLHKAGKADYLASHYAASLTRSLQRAAGLPPHTPIPELGRAARENTGAPTDGIVDAIGTLTSGSLDTKQMLRVVAEAERERSALRRRRR